VDVTYLHLDSDSDLQKRRAERRSEREEKEASQREEENESVRKQKIEKERQKEIIFVQKLVPLICIIYKGIRFSTLSIHVPFSERKTEKLVQMIYVIIYFGAKHMHVKLQ